MPRSFRQRFPLRRVFRNRSVGPALFLAAVLPALAAPPPAAAETSGATARTTLAPLARPVASSAGAAPASPPPPAAAETPAAPAADAPAAPPPPARADAPAAPAADAPAAPPPPARAETLTADAPATEAPADDGPATEAPADDGPATEAPADDAAATEAPATPLPEIRDAAACEAAIAADPATAREQAALWNRLGGGAEAEVCEAAALEALQAYGSAAGILTRLAENRRRLLAPALRLSIYEDAARLWLADERPDLALAILANLDTLAPPITPGRLKLRARAQAAEGDYAAAAATLLAADPADAEARTLRAAALRLGGDPAAAAAAARDALALAPDDPAALFEAGAAAAESGDAATARTFWMQLIRTHPDDPLATQARRNVAGLN